MSPRRIALRITLIYVTFGVLWILFSDSIVASFVTDVTTLSKVQTYKGWFYVLLTGVLFFFLTFGSLKYQQTLTERDALTGLLNRHMFRNQLDRLLQRLGKQHSHCTLILINLENFRQINNTAGQQIGDNILKQVANALSEQFAEKALLGRFAGDEFALAISDEQKLDIFESLQILQSNLEAITVPASPDLNVSARIGIATYPENGDSLKSLVTAATLALEEAKILGSGQIRVYNHRYGEEAQSRLEMLAELRTAINEEQLSVVYQPQFNLATRKITGVEVLVRWHREGKTSVRPDVFIPLAEQSGLVHPITDFVCKKAIQELKKYDLLGKKKAIPKVSINISARDFDHVSGADRFFERFSYLDDDWSTIQLEITETALMENFDQALPLLHQIRDKGIRISIDDFGTGYSSLGVLRKLPVRELKIDRSFTQEITENENDLQLVKAIIAMARSLNIKTLAEGVETTEQALMLKELECEEIQGFLMSPPLEIEQLVDFIARHQP